MKLKRTHKNLLVIIGLSIIPMLSFQNCSGTMHALETPGGTGNLSSGGGTGNVDEVIDGIETETSATRFQAARAVLQTHCAGCHYPGGSAVNLLFNTEQQFIEAGLVVSGDLSRSKLVYRMQNYTADIAERNMPPSLPPVPASQYQKLTSWILGMQGSPAQNYFTCNSNEAPDNLDAKRLSKTQLYNSLHGLLARPFGATAATSRMSGTSGFFRDRIPNDTRGPFSKSDNSFDYLHAKAYFDVADELSTWIVDTSRLSTFVTTYVNYAPGNCTSLNVNNLSANCRAVFVRNFTLRAWGRPIEENNNNNNNEMTSFLNEFAQASSNSVSFINNVIFKALTSPSFLMNVNIDISQQSGDIYKLSDYAIARRLALNYMNSGLDEGLLTIVQNSSQTSTQKFDAALSYVTARSEPAIREFTDEWLKLFKMPGLANAGHPKYARIAPGVNLSDASLLPAMRTEILDLMAYLNRAGRPVSEILTSNVSLAQNANLRLIYNQAASSPAWSQVTEANAVRFPAAERGGVITRAGYLFNGSQIEKLVLRGAHVRDQILCLESSGTIPADAQTTPLPTGTITTREKYNAVTMAPACIACHRQINPAGFSFSEYNALGGFQTSEPIFNNAGSYVTDLPIDNRVNMLAVTGESIDISGGVAFSREVAESRNFKRCLTQTFYSHFQGLTQKTRAQSSCTMEGMFQVIEGGGSVTDFVRAAAQNPRFQLRRLVRN